MLTSAGHSSALEVTAPAIRANVLHRETKIGDSLCTLPLILQLADLFGVAIHVQGAFSKLVRPLVAGLPIEFGRSDCGEPPINFDIDIQAAYVAGNSRNQHMAASICHFAGLDGPALPIDLGLASQQTGQPPGIVISPFSGSSNSWYKLWQLERWVTTIGQLLAALPTVPVHVIGGKNDQWAPFIAAGVTPLIDLQLTEVLSLLRQARVFLSIDNGLSHLAHFGGVQKHVLLYPAITAPNLVVNPRATVLTGRPEDIEVRHVVSAAMKVLAS